MKDKVVIYYYPKNSSKLRHAMEAVGVVVPHTYYKGMITVLVVKNSVVVAVGNTEISHIELVQQYTSDVNIKLERKTIKSDEEFYTILNELR